MKVMYNKKSMSFQYFVPNSGHCPIFSTANKHTHLFLFLFNLFLWSFASTVQRSATIYSSQAQFWLFPVYTHTVELHALFRITLGTDVEFDWRYTLFKHLAPGY